MKRNWPLILVAAGFLFFTLNGILNGTISPFREVFRVVLGPAGFAMIITGLVTTIIRRKFPMLLRLLSALLLLFVLGVCFVAYSYGRALRNADLISGKNDLKQARMEYEQFGYVTNRRQHCQVWCSSNVVSVAGKEHECFLTVRSERFNNEGSLAMTTNGVFIWLDA